ncbi:hypothetical protein DPMN_136921 [Dreissena polymorpha]|uniref:Uncharacterized protein n=1 Tax=Dreissena polymorpha TaxID=45954 RepID=A0A9D4JFZ8_DREPO|nr:hypothetical protein DPMN_136921 [Dreissena polymorpha]
MHDYFITLGVQVRCSGSALVSVYVDFFSSNRKKSKHKSKKRKQKKKVEESDTESEDSEVDEDQWVEVVKSKGLI